MNPNSLKSKSGLWVQFNLIPVHTCLCESGKEKKSAIHYTIIYVSILTNDLKSQGQTMIQ